MLGFPIGLLYSNAGEWLIHRHLLHGRGKEKSSFWSFHFHEHHRAARTHDMVDADYERPVLGDHAQGREALGLVALMAVHLPLFPVAPFFTSAVWLTGAMYYRRHKRAHQDPAWARKHIPWHVDHHLGPHQYKNWCVTWPWFDHIMGTRVPYVGTPREAADRARKAEREARRARASRQEAAAAA
ncbi:MAG: hypothetical protein H0V89_11460 [Deltaproteobacteria bacterium]|nr:hypothetical protein [Deltaproteobacteria bacterium]